MEIPFGPMKIVQLPVSMYSHQLSVISLDDSFEPILSCMMVCVAAFTIL